MKLLLYLFFSYFIGSLMTGYMIGKWIGGFDISREGSGNIGARNAGRLLGKKAFALTFLGDGLKGMAAVWMGKLFFHSVDIQILGLAAAIFGHIKPITLRFRGGKGVSTFIGGIAVLEPYSLLTLIGSFLVLYIPFQSFTMAGLGAIVFTPLFIFLLGYSWLESLLVLGIAVLILLAHRENIRENFSKNG
jgi:acyl phosphate:glycerol-3-phosphate acyltransferase